MRGWRAVLGATVLLTFVPFPLPPKSTTPTRPGAPTALTTDGNVNTLGVDAGDVELAWHVTDPRAGAVQSAYRIVVNQGRRTVWDSARIPSGAQAFVRYAGPALAPDTVYTWTVQTWDAKGQAGPASDEATFTTGLGDHDWSASWITRTSTNPLDSIDDFTYARHQVTLGRSPIARATAYVAADQFYELWVNGTRAGKGQAISYPDTQHYEALDVTSLLHAGRVNAVGLLTQWEGTGKGRPAGQAAELLQISVTHADGSHEVVGTDGTWKVERANWLASTPRNQQGDDIDYTENISGLTEPVGWDQPGYNDLTWQTATVVGRPPVAPWTHLVPQQTHIVEEPVPAVTLKTLSSGAVVADFGSVIAAVPTVTFHQGVPGRAITMHAGFLLDPSGAVSTTKGTQSTDMSYSYVERSGVQTFHPFDYLGFRYFQIDSPGETLRPSDVVALARHNAVPDEHAATFTSSDPTVDAVWNLAAHSALFASQEQFLDTPTREKSPFLRDGYNISLAAMDAFGEQNLTRRVLLEFAQSQARYWPDGRLNAVYPSGDGKRDIPDFTLIYPDWVWQYWLHTGDTALVAQVYPVVRAIADYAARYIGPSGLVTNLAGGDDNPGNAGYQHGIVDWPPNMRYGYDMATVARTTVNLLALQVFERTAQLAPLVGAPAAANQARATALTAAINGRLIRGDGLYIDGLEANGAQSANASQHANAYALAYGVVPPSRQAAVAAYTAGAGMQMGPQTAQELLAGLDAAGRDDAVVARLTDTHADGWANELAQGGTFTWETWRPSDANGDSMSHGWGSAVLVNIQEELLGVRPTGPGYATFDVIPPASGLDHASGTVPTPRGPIVVSWQRPSTPGGTFLVNVTVPPNSTARVLLPAAGAVGGVRAMQVGSGAYKFHSTGVPASFAGRQPAAAGVPAPGAPPAHASGPAAPVGVGPEAVTGAHGGGHAGRWVAVIALLLACAAGVWWATRLRGATGGIRR